MIRYIAFVALLALTAFAGCSLRLDPALTELRRQADRGVAIAQYNLAIRYANGEGVFQSDARATRWFRLASEQGHAAAQYNLGRMYIRAADSAFRVPVPRTFSLFYIREDLVLADMWLNIAGANGNEAAKGAREILARELTRAEFARATDLARRCLASIYRNCGP